METTAPDENIKQGDPDGRILNYSGEIAHVKQYPMASGGDDPGSKQILKKLRFRKGKIEKTKNEVKPGAMAVEARDKAYQCIYCDYKCRKKHHLQTHVMAIHRGEKSHCCPHCDYKASQAINVRTHVMAVHKGEKPYQCPHCDYKATQSSNLKRHVTGVHKGEKCH